MEIDCGYFKIRLLQEEDSESMALYANNRSIWINVRNVFPHPYYVRDAELFIELCKHNNPPTNFCIEYNNECVGVISFIPQTDVYSKSAEIGYWLGKPFWQKGIMTLAVKEMIDYIFKHFDIVRIYAGVFEWNRPSMMVLEKAGFVCDGIFEKAVYKDGQLINEHRYSLIKK